MIHSPDPHSQTSLRRERERELRRVEILGAAERIFAAKGFHEASMENIASSAGFAIGTLYLYFEDKEALYMAVFVGKLTQMIDHVETCVREARQPVDALRRAIGAQLEFHDRNRSFFEIFSRERQPAGKGTEWRAVCECFERHTAVLRSLIEAGQRRRLLRKGDSQRLALMLLGMLLHLTRDLIQRGSSEPLADQCEFVTNLFLHGAAVEGKAA